VFYIDSIANPDPGFPDPTTATKEEKEKIKCLKLTFFVVTIVTKL
jgi:hypothetical protein